MGIRDIALPDRYGRAPASPNTAKIVASWMGPVRRGLGVSFHIVASGWGGRLRLCL